MSKPELDDQALKAVLGGMSEAELKRLIDTTNGLANMGTSSAVHSFIPNEKQILIAASKKKNVVVYGGNRCLGGETEIYDPVLGVNRRVDEIDGPFHVYAWDGQSRVIADAEAPFIKEPQDIYKVTMDDGSWFTASPHHQVLTPMGWSSLSALGIAYEYPNGVSKLLQADLCQPRTSLDISRLVHAEDVHHSSQIVEDSQSDYPNCLRLGDEQLPWNQGDARCAEPSLVDVQEHTHTQPFGSVHGHAPCRPSGHPPQSKLSGSHVCRTGSRPSTLGDRAQSVDHVVGIESPHGHKPWTLVWKKLQVVTQWLRGSNHPRPTDASRLRANPSSSDLTSVSEGILQSCPITSTKKVIGVQHLRKDHVWDFTVPIYHNYECAGVVHHNSGKSHISAFIVACHATGIYPEWWEGIKFYEPPSIGVVSITAEQLRKSSQKKLMGEFYNLGTGFIPKDKIIRTTARQGVVGALDTALIRHISGGITKIEFMLNEQGKEKFMGFEWDFFWGDEELDKEIFDEIKMRLMDRGGYALLSFAPLKGQTDLISHIDSMPEEYVDIFRLDWYDNPHLPKDAVAEMEATMSDSDKESRKLGRANYGEGRVFTFDPARFTCDPFEVEPYWPVLGAIDPGYGHATGAVKLYLDPESGVIYVTSEYWSKENTPIVHAPVFKGWGNMEFKLDRKSKTRDQTSGMSVMDMYLDLGLNVTEAETNAGSVEASIAMINTLIMQGKLQIFKTCRKLLDQMAMYRRSRNKSTGKIAIVMKDNDLIDPLRYAILHIDEARPMGVPKKMQYSSPKVVDFQPMDSRIGY